ncbi:GNAT family N-acetyltransferase [Aliiroseovarius crassostreae]|uniref:GNAT family N-acetyltransferase n=1 Tax=Aliiroseovarius crassostreae TaxID=154981 RepID=UPI0022014BB3|nr:GNAT family N-acetyltransferase [Aliiroseovarius crassostreae]UWQ07726.1 GNAT family N-acetyltransferase [Aliiroseovarius crassostreae]
MSIELTKVRQPDEIDAVRMLVWEFFDFLRIRYPEMLDTIEAYLVDQDVAGELENFDQYFLPPHGECFLARHRGEPAGIVMMKPHGEHDAEMNRMYVRDNARGLGIGRKLGQALIAEARLQGLGAVWLDALYRHVEALPLYESLGFEYYSDPDAFGGDDKRILHMKLVL